MFLLWKLLYQIWWKRLLGIIHLAHTQSVLKTYDFLTLIRMSKCAYQRIRNITFSETFAYILNEYSFNHQKTSSPLFIL